MPGGLVGLDAHAADLEAFLNGLVAEAAKAGSSPSSASSASSGADDDRPASGSGSGSNPRKAQGLVKVKKRADGPVKLLVIYGPSSCGKSTLAEVALERTGFVKFRPAPGSQGASLFGSALDFCKSSVSGVGDMMRGSSAVRGKALLIYDALGAGTKYSVGALADEIRAVLRTKKPPWPVVLVATSQGTPGKSSDLSRSADARMEVAHPGWKDCNARLQELFGGEEGLSPERLLAGAKKAAGGGMVASLTAAYNPHATGKGPRENKAPPMYSGFFEKVGWAVARANEPPDSETYREIHSAISNEPALAALVLRESYRPNARACFSGHCSGASLPVDSGPLAEAKRRLAYMSLANGVEEFRGSEGMASETAAAAFEGMAAHTDPEAELSFPMSYTVASARSNSMQRGPGRPPRPGGCPRPNAAAKIASPSTGSDDEESEADPVCVSPWAACNATVARYATRRLDGALLGLRQSNIK